MGIPSILSDIHKSNKIAKVGEIAFQLELNSSNICPNIRQVFQRNPQFEFLSVMLLEHHIVIELRNSQQYPSEPPKIYM
jgi:hypothetical protein